MFLSLGISALPIFNIIQNLMLSTKGTKGPPNNNILTKSPLNHNILNKLRVNPNPKNTVTNTIQIYNSLQLGSDRQCD